MAIRGGPDIIEDGLVLHLDAAEPLCFRGEPTTNLISDPFMVNGSPSPIIMAYEGTGTVTSDLPDSSMHSVSNKWMKVVKNSSTNGRMLFLGLSGLTVGVDYCFSVYVYTNDTNLTSIYPNTDNVSVSPIYSSVAYNLSNRGTIQRIHCIFRTTSGGQVIGIRVGSTNPIGSTFYFTGIQVEQKSYPTRVANGTRGSTVATGGGLLDLTNNGNNGAITRAASPSAAFYNGNNGGSFVFDGSNDYVVLQDSNTLDVSSALTEEAWVYIHAYTDRGTVATKNLSYYFQVHINGTVQIYSYWQNGSNPGNSSYNSSSATVPLNTWTYIAWTEDTSGLRKIYINGNFDSQHSAQSTIYNNTYELNIGGQYWDSTLNRLLDGQISSVRVYNRALSEDEIRQNYNATKGRFGL